MRGEGEGMQGENRVYLFKVGGIFCSVQFSQIGDLIARQSLAQLRGLEREIDGVLTQEMLVTGKKGGGVCGTDFSPPDGSSPGRRIRTSKVRIPLSKIVVTFRQNCREVDPLTTARRGVAYRPVLVSTDKSTRHRPYKPSHLETVARVRR